MDFLESDSKPQQQKMLATHGLTTNGRALPASQQHMTTASFDDTSSDFDLRRLTAESTVSEGQDEHFPLVLMTEEPAAMIGAH